MNELLKEFLSYILTKNEVSERVLPTKAGDASAAAKRIKGKKNKPSKRVTHQPGDVWQTLDRSGNPTGKWSAKRSDGTPKGGFETREKAIAWRDGRGEAPGEETPPEVVRVKSPERYMSQPKKDSSQPPKTTQDTPPVEEIPEYLQGRSAASAGVISPAAEIEVTGADGSKRRLSVRQVLDENGNPIDITTSEGRIAARERLDERIKQSQQITLRALKDFPKNAPASQWVGEIGEMYALRDLLEQDVEAYMATASNPESDLIKVDRNGSKGLAIVEISAKATKEKGAVGAKGANARAIFSKMGEGKQATIPGIEGSVSAKTAVNIVYDVREKLGAMLTDGMVVEVPGEKDRAIELSDEELAKCTPEYQVAYKKSGAKSGGKSVRQNFALYERSRIIQDDDIDKLRTKMLSDIDGNKRKTDEEKEREKVIVEHYIKRLRERMVGKPLSDLRQTTLEDVGEIYDNTDPPTDLVIDSDLVVIRFNPQTGVPEVKIAKWENVKNCIDEKENKSRESTVGQALPDREVDPQLADKTVGDVIDQECKRSNGTTKWKCQFMKYIGHSFPSQARLRSAKGNAPRRGKLQLKLNWSPPTNCVEEHLQDPAEYVK